MILGDSQGVVVDLQEILRSNRKIKWDVEKNGNEYYFVVKAYYVNETNKWIHTNQAYLIPPDKLDIFINRLKNKMFQIPLAPFHQILIAYELTLRRASNDMRKLEVPLSSAMVDLNPHQVDAALFAFKGPLSKGAILCDEVGLGKTIEAGLIVSQLWAEGKRKIIVVVPASIRRQWQNELMEKFGVPSIVVDGFEFRAAKKRGMLNPFDRGEIVITSIPFASMKASEIAAVGRWELAVLDESHRLRNVYKKTGSKQAKN